MSALKTLLLPLSLTVLLCLGLSACSSGPGEEEFAPQILAVYSDIVHRHPSFYEKWPNNPQRSIDFTFSINVSDPQGIENILSVYVTDLNDNYHWSLFDANEANPWTRCFRGAGVFECRFYAAIHPDYSNLQNFEVVVQDLSGYTRRKAFNFLLADGEQPDLETFVYSEQFKGGTNNGYEALDVMTIEDNAMVFTADAGTQSFHIEFEVSDARAKEYALDFYDTASPANYIGSVKLDSTIIQDHPIDPNLSTVAVDIPWDEINFEDGFSVDDIKRLHINLYDNPIPWVINNSDAGLWFNHQATSQSISLPE